MNRGIVKKLLFASVLAGTIAATSQADACWPAWRGYCAPSYIGWTGYSYSYYGCGVACCTPTYTACYTPSYVGCCDPCYTVCGYRGCGLFSRWRYRVRAHHWGYYCGTCWCDPCCCDPCYTTSCCTICGYSDCGCGYTTSGNVIDYSVPSAAPADAPAGSGPTLADPPADGTLPETQTSITRDAAFLTVNVPSDARVLVNGVPTSSTGPQRRYVSRNLVPGFDYTYEVKARFTVDGKPVTQTRTVQLQAGRQANLAFQSDAPKTLETALTLHVPANAKVFLAGNETKGSGAVRTFRTSKLSEGQSWGEYIVRVVINEDGRARSMEETISLKAGDQRELSFDFDIDQVASIR